LILKAPAPIFAALKRLNNRVLGRMEMLGGVLVARRVAATNMAAAETFTEMNPAITSLETVFTTLGTRRHFTNLIQM
jgi:hypothetical protein